MSRFLLLFCFTSLHVLGNGQEYASPTISDHLNTTTITPRNNGGLVQDSETNLPLYKIIESMYKEKTKLKLEESTTTIHSSQNPSLYTTVASPNITTVSTSATESTAKQIPYTAVSPTKASVNSASTTAAAFPNPGKWMVNETDKICIIVQMAVQFNVSYIDASNKTSFEVFDLPIDNTTTTNGSCGNLEQELKLMWSSRNGTNNGTMTLHFIRKENDTDYSLHHLNVTLPRTDFPKLVNKSDSVELMYEPSDFKAQLSNSYKCMKQQRLYLIQNNDNTTNITTSYLTISDLRFQAFRTDNSTVLGLAQNCVVDTEDIVPIAVGCVLAGLVFIVLIAYLIGRRRNRALGYLSM